MDTKDWITAVVAVYGAILSTYNLLVARGERTRQVTTTLSWGLLGIGPEPVTAFFLTAANPGRRTVTITGCHLLLPNRKQIVMPHAHGTVQLPYNLEEGKNCMFWFPVTEVVRSLISEGFSSEVSLKAVFRDALGKTYESKPFRGNIQEWALVK